MAQTAVPPAGGDGTPANPYQIATLGNLYWMASNGTGSNKWFVQTADINASETSSWFGGQGWTSATINSGSHYNGRGHVIDSLYINQPQSQFRGLFCINGGTIENLGITHANITGDASTGALVGLNDNIVRNCFSTGSLNGIQRVGGLVGHNGIDGSIFNSSSGASTTGSLSVGGLVGENQGSVGNSYSTGSVSGTKDVGGLIGFNIYATALLNCYSAGKVTGAASVGGLIGSDSTRVTYDSFWNVETSGQASSASGTGIDSSEMRNASFFSDAGWPSSVWSMDAGFNSGYPYLSWQNPGGTPIPTGTSIPPSTGDGSEQNPYQIATLENLNWIARNPIVSGAHFVQVADIDASRTSEWNNGEGWIPIGACGILTGTYNGTGHIIDGLSINRPTATGWAALFAIATNATIDSLGVTNVNFVGGGGGGALAGYDHFAVIKQCFSTGIVKGTKGAVGGLIGRAFDTLTVSDCYSRVEVTGAQYAGGLIGDVEQGATIEHCYSTGSVTSDLKAGGLIGYSVAIHPVISSFWDIGTSGRAASAGGTGKTTLQMKMPATFSESSWSDTLWCMDSSLNDGYPYLSWQNPNGTRFPLLPGFSISADSANFGDVLLNSSVKDSVLISNPGTDTLRITSIVSTDSSFTFSPGTLQLAPSANVYLKLMFAPDDTSEQTGYIILTHNATVSPDTLVVTGRGVLPTTVKSGIDLPTAFTISQNYPNPFNPSTVFEFDIPKSTFVSLKVYDILGREVAQLVNEVKYPGRYSISYDGTKLSSGVYFYSITAGAFHQVRKMVLVK